MSETNPPSLPHNEEGIFSYLRELSKYLVREFRKRPEKDTAVDSVILVSPNGSVYTVRVDDAGALTTTLMYDAT